MKPHRSSSPLPSFAAGFAFACAALSAGASPVSSSSVSGPQYGTVSTFGTASSDAVAAGAEARSSVDVAHATMSALATVDGAQSLGAMTDTRHQDTWGCPANASCTSTAPTSAIPVNFHLHIDGSVLDDIGGARNYLFFARYGTSFGDSFSMEVERDGSGATPFLAANFNGVAIPIVIDETGNVIRFSLDADIIVMETFSRIAAPSFSDDQEITVQASSISGPNGGPEFVDALHTFSVTLASLDPEFDLVSADGRGLAPRATTTVPEPGPLSLVALGLVAWMTTRRRVSRGRLAALLSATLALSAPIATRADSLSASNARSACVASGASSPSALRACCDDKILEDPPSKQRRLVNECASGAKQAASPDDKAADEDARNLRRTELASRAANPNGKAMKHAAPAPATDESASPTPAATSAANCANYAGVIAQAREIARRFGTVIPATDCATAPH